MGLVTDNLVNRIFEQIKVNHVVVWFDPGQQYEQVAVSLSIPGTKVALYDEEKGFLSLRRELEPAWNQESPPKLLIYTPPSPERNSACAYRIYNSWGSHAARPTAPREKYKLVVHS